MNNIVDDEYLMYNTSPRVPVCVCIDTSATIAESPVVSNILSQVEKGVNAFYTKMMEDDMVCNCAEVAVVSYGDTVSVVQDYMCTSKFQQEIKIPVTNTMTGSGDMGSGVLESLELLQSRKQAYNAHGVDYYRPWLVVITDGKPNRKELKKNLVLAQKKLLGLEKSQKITVITLYINGNEGTELSDITLAEITKKSNDKKIQLSKVVSPQIIGTSKIGRFFDWLADSVRKFAFENDIKLDFSGLTDWEDI